MKLLMAKFGSKASPSKPRSPSESTVRLTNGVGSNAPFLITRNWPPCKQTNKRPSGAKSIAVGLERPLLTRFSVKPAGKVAPSAKEKHPETHKPTARLNASRRINGELLVQIAPGFLLIMHFP